MSKLIKYLIAGLFLFGLGSFLGNLILPRHSAVLTSVPSVKTFATKDLVNMTEEDFNKIKEKEIMKMIIDTSVAHGIKPSIFVGLSYHESAKFKYANQKIKDSNGKWSYGLFMIQLETALEYDKNATEEKLLTPTYNTSMAAKIFDHNLKKYGSITYAIAAHNAGVIYNKKITNADFVKLVYAAIGEVVSKYDL
jgi:hypothetical protein